MNIDTIGFILFFIAILFSFYYYDRTVKTEYLNHHEQWVKDGSPLGMFWVPKGSKLFSGSFSRGALMFQLLFKNPQWAKNDKTVLQYLRKLRTSWAIGAVVWLIMVINMFSKR